MIKLLFTLMVVFFTAFIQSTYVDLEYIRKNYEQAVDDASLCSSMIEQLSKNQESNVHLAYLGAFQSIWANHVTNPVSKLNTFNKGKGNIEKAVKMDPDNVEVRFVRLTIQNNCPKFLGYSENIEEDKLFLKNNMSKISSSTLKRMIEQFN